MASTSSLSYFSTLCRCCGCLNQPGLHNLNTRFIKVPTVLNGVQYLKLEKWFLAFTNLDEATYKSEYSSICTPCEEKLLAAYTFRNSCLVAEKTFVSESSSAPIAIDDEEDDDPLRQFETVATIDVTSKKADSSIQINNLDLPKGLKIEFITQNKDIVPASLGFGRDYTMTVGNEANIGNTMPDDCKFVATPNFPPLQKPKLSCKFCKKLFRKQSELTLHLQTHKKTYNCSFCSEKFRLNKLYQIHMHTHKEAMKKIECTMCAKRYDDEEKFQLHIKAHEDGNGFPCDDCGKNFILAQTLARHRASDHPPIPCKLCLRSFTQGQSMKLHMLQHAGIKFVCDVCDYREFTNHGALIEHLKSEHKTKLDETTHLVFPEENDNSEDLLNNAEVYLEEEVRPSESLQYSCYKCNEKFRTKIRLRHHMKCNHTEVTAKNDKNEILIINNDEFLFEEIVMEDLSEL